jgi:predicted nucleic acid-binding protein
VLVDANVWSELTRPRPEPQLSAWIGGHFGECLLSTIVLAEIRYGIALAPDDRRAALRSFLDDLLLRLGDRVVDFDASAADAFGALRARLKVAGQLIGERDMLIAGHALSLGVPLVTRNVSDMARTGASIVNPLRA